MLFALQPYLPYRIWPFSWLPTARSHSSGQCSGDHFSAVISKPSGTQSRLFPKPVCLERANCPHLLGLDAPETEPGFGLHNYDLNPNCFRNVFVSRFESGILTVKLGDSGIPDYTDPAEIFFLPYEVFHDLSHKRCTPKGWFGLRIPH